MNYITDFFISICAILVGFNFHFYIIKDILQVYNLTIISPDSYLQLIFRIAGIFTVFFILTKNIIKSFKPISTHLQNTVEPRVVYEAYCFSRPNLTPCGISRSRALNNIEENPLEVYLKDYDAITYI